MPNPKCDQCSWHPEMAESGRGRVFEIHPGQGYAVTHSLQRSGHPALALAATIFGGVAGATNHFFEEIKYKCKSCSAEKKQTKRKQ